MAFEKRVIKTKNKMHIILYCLSTTLSHTPGANSSFVDFGYTYNPVGNLTGIIDNLAAAQMRPYSRTSGHSTLTIKSCATCVMVDAEM